MSHQFQTCASGPTEMKFNIFSIQMRPTTTSTTRSVVSGMGVDGNFIPRNWQIYSPRFAWGGPPTPQVYFGPWEGLRVVFPRGGLFKLRSFNKKSFPKHCFWQCFSNVSSQTDGNLHVFCHKGSKSFQNSAFDSVFVMFPVKHTVIYTFFAITSVQNTCFCSVFNALASKNPAKSCYVQCFFHFWPFFHCRKATKMTQNSISIPSCAQTPKNPRKMSKTPPYSGLGAKPFLAPPPQLKLI